MDIGVLSVFCGEVYKAAVPTGLKPESETSVTLNQDFEADSDDTHFTERQAIVIQLLEQKKRSESRRYP